MTKERTLSIYRDRNSGRYTGGSRVALGSGGDDKPNWCMNKDPSALSKAFDQAKCDST